MTKTHPYYLRHKTERGLFFHLLKPPIFCPLSKLLNHSDGSRWINSLGFPSPPRLPPSGNPLLSFTKYMMARVSKGDSFYFKSASHPHLDSLHLLLHEFKDYLIAVNKLLTNSLVNKLLTLTEYRKINTPHYDLLR